MGVAPATQTQINSLPIQHQIPAALQALDEVAQEVVSYFNPPTPQIVAPTKICFEPVSETIFKHVPPELLDIICTKKQAISEIYIYNKKILDLLDQSTFEFDPEGKECWCTFPESLLDTFVGDGPHFDHFQLIPRREIPKTDMTILAPGGETGPLNPPEPPDDAMNVDVVMPKAQQIPIPLPIPIPEPPEELMIVDVSEELREKQRKEEEEFKLATRYRAYTSGESGMTVPKIDFNETNTQRDKIMSVVTTSPSYPLLRVLPLAPIVSKRERPLFSNSDPPGNPKRYRGENEKRDVAEMKIPATNGNRDIKIEELPPQRNEPDEDEGESEGTSESVSEPEYLSDECWNLTVSQGNVPT